MKTIAFLTQKGGSGKTTLAVHMAVAAEQDAQRVVIIDTDQQASAMAWVNVREHETPVVVSVVPSQINDVIEAGRHDAMTLAIVDTAPHAAPGASEAASAADFILIPCRPTAFDLAAVATTVEIAKAVGKPAAFVLNACAPRAPEIHESREALNAYGFPVVPITIGNRQSFSRAIASGRAVIEFERSGKAAAEINALWGWIKENVL